MYGYKGNSLVFGNPSISISTGELHYRICGVSQGEGLYRLSCGLVFDSGLPAYFDQNIAGLDPHFKLSSVMLLRQGVDDYVFYDTEGFTHRLVRIGASTVYRDENATGLKYDSSTGVLCDGGMLRYDFEDCVNAKRIKHVRAVIDGNEIFCLTYSYSASYLTQMSCDSRRIEFTYENGLLAKIVLFIDTSPVQCIRLVHDSEQSLTSVWRRNPSYQDSNPTISFPSTPPFHSKASVIPGLIDLPSADDLRLRIASFAYDESYRVTEIVDGVTHEASYRISL